MNFQKRKLIKNIWTYYLDIYTIEIEIILDIKFFHIIHLKQLYIFFDWREFINEEGDLCIWWLVTAACLPQGSLSSSTKQQM